MHALRAGFTVLLIGPIFYRSYFTMKIQPSSLFAQDAESKPGPESDTSISFSRNTLKRRSVWGKWGGCCLRFFCAISHHSQNKTDDFYRCTDGIQVKYLAQSLNLRNVLTITHTARAIRPFAWTLQKASLLLCHSIMASSYTKQALLVCQAQVKCSH